VNRLIRAYAEIKGDMDSAGYTIAEQMEIYKNVVDYTDLKERIGRASGDFIDLKSYEVDMRRNILTGNKFYRSRALPPFWSFPDLNFRGNTENASFAFIQTSFMGYRCDAVPPKAIYRNAIV
jgi:type I restriction enzyme R subunit